MNNVYNAIFYNVLAVGAGDGWTFNALFPYREMKIKSITWDLRLWPTGIVANTPLEIINVIDYSLTVGDIINRTGLPFDVTTTPPGGVIINSYQMQFFIPKQYIFNSFFGRNFLPLVLQVMNRDPLKSWTYQSTVILETEEKLLENTYRFNG